MSCGCDAPGINPSSGTKVKVDSSDTTANFLASKVAAGSNVTLTVLNPGGNEQLQIAVTAGAIDHKVSVSAADTTPNYLFSKLAAVVPIVLTLLNPAANEQVQISVNDVSNTSKGVAPAITATTAALVSNGAGTTSSWVAISGGGSPVGTSRTINTTAPLTGGGNLSADRTFTVNTVSNTTSGVVTSVGATGTALISTETAAAWGNDFGAQTLTTTGDIIQNSSTAIHRIGTTTAGATRAATTGTIRLVAGASIIARNSADTADLPLIQQGPTSDVTVGSNSNVSNLVLVATSTLKLRITNFVAVQIISTGILIFGNQISWDTATTTPSIGQSGSSSAAGQNFSISAQDTSAASQNGGKLILNGGTSSNATPGLLGGIQMKIGTGATSTMLEMVNLAGTSRVLSLSGGGAITTTNMPANTGDLVTFIGNTATNPSANSVGGGIMYSNAGALTWRGPGGTTTVMGAA